MRFKKGKGRISGALIGKLSRSPFYGRIKNDDQQLHARMSLCWVRKLRLAIASIASGCLCSTCRYDRREQGYGSTEQSGR